MRLRASLVSLITLSGSLFASQRNRGAAQAVLCELPKLCARVSQQVSVRGRAATIMQQAAAGWPALDS